MQDSNDDLLQIKRLKVSFPLDEGTVQALDGIDLTARKGRVVGIVGESGCGKSMTARSILRILPPPGRIDQGEILLRTKVGSPDGSERVVNIASLGENDKLLREIRWGEISMIFQEPMTSFSAYHTLGDQMMEALRVHRKVPRREARNATIEMLDRVGIPNAAVRVNQYPHEFSGGMRQRAMIGMALICNPSLLIADEPTTSLDVTIQAQMLDLMKDLRKDFGSSIMFITHNLGVIAQIADEVSIMYLGKIVEQGPVKSIFHNHKHPYTSALVDAIPKIGKSKNEYLTTITGSVPNPFERPAGCPFHNRCPQVIPGTCNVKEPGVVHFDQGHDVSCFLYE